MVDRPCVVRPGDVVARSCLGGKAGSLWRLAEHGFPVPEFAVVTTEAYRQVASRPDVQAALARIGSGPTDGDDRTTVETIFLSVPIPDDLRDAILRAAREIAGSAGALAVRSSASAEDLGGASFAGQYRSFLDVPPDDRVIDAVRRTWASLWSPPARQYRQQHGIDDNPGEAGPAMAVVLMEMVQPERAGVAFTVDPTGDEATIRIEDVHGLADRLVSGEETPTVTLVPRPDINGADIDDTPAVLRDVANLALRAEALFGCPQDVEWVWDGTIVKLVQSRPITAFGASDDDGFDHFDPHTRWTTAGIAEMLPGHVPPLVWETFGRIVDHAFLTLFDDLDALPDHDTFALARLRGQAAMNLDLLEQVAALIPGLTPESLERQLLGSTESPGESSGASATRGHAAVRARLAHDVRVARLQRTAVREGEVVSLALDLLLDESTDVTSPSDAELLSYRSRLVDLLCRATIAEVEVAAGAAAAYERLLRFLAAYEPATAAETAGRVTRNVHGAGELNHWTQFARQLRRTTAGRRALATPDPDAALGRLGTTIGDTSAAFDHTMRRAGSRSIATGQTWSEDRAAAWRMVGAAAHRRNGGGGRPTTEDVIAHLATTRRWRRLKLLTGIVIDSQAVMLRRRVREASELLERRESLKSTVLAIGGEIRRTHLEIGRRLVARGLLGDSVDVDLLGVDELATALQGAGPGAVELLRRRRRGDRAATTPLPVRFIGRPTADGPPLPVGDRFHGWAASPGSYEGVARVVRTSSDHIERDEVLVARTTDPSWGPLFLSAGALVIEQGGPLSHAAIVARELGLPAVVNVPGVMERVRSGDRVLVDGTSGTVIVERGPDVTPPHDPPADEGVFVPAVMGAGLLFSVLVIVRDWLDRILGGERRRQSAAAQARLLAHHVVHGDGASDGQADLARRRRILGTLAGLSLGLAAYLVPGALGNYLRPGGYLAEIGWILAITAVLVVASLTVGSALAVSALHPDHPSPVAVRALRLSDATLHTGLFATEPRHHEWGHRWHGTASIVVLATAVCASVLTIAVEMGAPALSEWDVSVVRSLRTADGTSPLHAFTWIGRIEVAAVAAVVTAIVMWRRERRHAITHPTAVAVAFGLTQLLSWIIDRIGPLDVDGGHASSTYPSSIAVQSTLLVVMSAFTVTRATGRRLFGTIAAVVLGLAAGLAGTSGILSGREWPSDVIGGVLVGLLVAIPALLAAHRGPVADLGHRRFLVVSERTAALVGRATSTWVIIALGSFVVLSITVGIPDNPYAGLGLPMLKRTAQIASLVLVSIAALVARRWRATGAVMLAVAGTVMAVLASIQYRPAVAVVISLAFLLPAFGHWVAWQHGRPLRTLVAPAVVSALLVSGTWVGATAVYERYFGPTHPQSTLAPFSTDHVLWVWTGGLGDQSVTVNARLRQDDPAGTATIRLVTAAAPNIGVEPAAVDRTGRTISARFEDLTPDTEYRYSVVVEGRADLSGSVRTAATGPASFVVTFGSCARTGSNGAVFETIASHDPLLHIVLGDFHYGDVSTADAERLRSVLDATISAPAQQSLYLSTAIAYVWDDHDFGGNDSDADSAARSTAQAVYREYVPHVSLPSDEGIHQAFTIGRVRFVLTDLRSYRRPASDGTGQLMGSEELAWFEHELVTARDNGQVVVWVNPTPWIGGAAPGSDTWAGFAEQRRLIADFLADEGIDRILMLSGDAHMLAIDDGTNSDYSTDGAGGFVVAHGSAFDRPGGTKGGPFSEGMFPGGGQFGLLQVIDDGGPTITFVVSGRNWQDHEIVRYEFSI